MVISIALFKFFGLIAGEIVRLADLYYQYVLSSDLNTLKVLYHMIVIINTFP